MDFKVKIDKQIRVGGFWLMPGSVVGFRNKGEANSFIFRQRCGKHVEPPKPKQRDTGESTGPKDGAKPKAGNPRTGKSDAPAVNK